MMISPSACDPFGDHCCHGFYLPSKSQRKRIIWIKMDRLPNLMSFAKFVQGLFVIVVVGLTVTKLLRPPKNEDPLEPLVPPFVGSWLQGCALLDSCTCIKRESMYGYVRYSARCLA